MPRILKLAVSQSRTLSTTAKTINALEEQTVAAAGSGVHLILFPEAYIGGYPRTCTFGASVGARDPIGREQFLAYFHAAVDLGDTPVGAGDDWVERKLPVAKGAKRRGDGTREELERIARETSVFIVTGLVEKAGGSLYCSVVYVCPKLGILGKRRKVMPTGMERLIWAQGHPRTLKAVTTTIDGVKLTMAAAICWENYMPLLRQALYSQNVNLYLSPTADARDNWLPLMRTVGFESRAFVLSSNQCMRRKHLPEWIRNPSPVQLPRPTHTGFQSSSKPPRRRRSIIIPEDTHEIWLPVKDGRDFGDGNGSTKLDEGLALRHSITAPTPTQRASSATSHSPHQSPTRRRKSIIIPEDTHEICLPVTGDPVGEEEAVATQPTSVVDDDDGIRTQSPPQRRRSVITETPEHHEISWPVPKVSPKHSTSSEPSLPHNASWSATDEEFVSRGGSCIVNPMGQVLTGPLWEVEDAGLLTVEADFDDCDRGRLDLDVAGSYSRNDAFRLTVDGLDLNPPP